MWGLQAHAPRRLPRFRHILAEIIRHFFTFPWPHCPPCIYSKAVFTSALKTRNSPAAGKRVYHLAFCPENKMLQKGHKKKVSWGRKEKNNNPSLSRLIEWKVNFHHMLSLCESCPPLNTWRGQLGGEWAGRQLGGTASVDSASAVEERMECADTVPLYPRPRPL